MDEEGLTSSQLDSCFLVAYNFPCCCCSKWLETSS